MVEWREFDEYTMNVYVLSFLTASLASSQLSDTRPVLGNGAGK